MADPTAGRPPVRRRKKRPPKWQRMLRYYWPAVRILLVLAGCIVLIALTIGAFTNGLGKRAEAKKHAAQLQSSNTAHSEARRTAVRMIALEICIGMCFFCMERRPVPSFRS